MTAGLLDVASYRSRGLYAEVKVAEALDRAAAAAAMACHATAAAPEDCNPGQPPPNALVTAVACQVGWWTSVPEAAYLPSMCQSSLSTAQLVIQPALSTTHARTHVNSCWGSWLACAARLQGR